MVRGMFLGGLRACGAIVVASKAAAIVKTVFLTMMSSKEGPRGP